MTGRERFQSILEKHRADRIGFWMGEPVQETMEQYIKETGAKDRQELSVMMQDDFRWIAPDFTCWPEGIPMFDVLGGQKRTSLSQPGIFAECESLAEIESYKDWPDPALLDLDKLDTFFMGNDLGTQRAPLLSPEMYRKFVLPSQKRMIEQAKSYGLHVMVHSCGAISSLIPDMIDAGIEALHPLQPLAAGMDAACLSQFKRDLAFVGGVDTQQILPNGTPEDVKREVDRLYRAFGDGWIASPSHEGVLPNIPLRNVQAIREAAMRL